MPHLETSQPPTPNTDTGPVERICGRCRGVFAGDPTLPASVMAEWWSCPACRVALLGRSGDRA